MGAHDPDITAIIDDILAAEGSEYTNRATDRGGPTKYGITQATLSAYWGRVASPGDVAALDEVMARCIYREMYVTQPGFHDIPFPRVRTFVVDCGVHSGTATAARWLQRVVGAQPDGVVGPKTLAALRDLDPTRVFLALVAFRIQHLGRLITRDPRQADYAQGWMNRVATFLLDQR
ncbi:glycoside hydrolase family 108 protein [Rhodospirillum sp. A1_3_36]|uniref:glycoside hydrolase family 108 protein n=1 Tax=Rhodospirillum sp. A1_3_36 TaxID=3391666 RepID=UPI0039A78516